jgi:hypothetical protein
MVKSKNSAMINHMIKKSTDSFPEVQEAESEITRPAYRPKFILMILAALLIITSAAAIYFWRQFSQLKQNPQQAAQEEAQQVMALVARHMILPEGETPTIATVTDPEKLKGQPFFEHAKLNDKVLIYTNAKKAILYDPEADRIIDVAPLNIGNQ